jgi:hypothetical protein
VDARADGENRCCPAGGRKEPPWHLSRGGEDLARTLTMPEPLSHTRAEISPSSAILGVCAEAGRARSASGSRRGSEPSAPEASKAGKKDRRMSPAPLRRRARATRSKRNSRADARRERASGAARGGTAPRTRLSCVPRARSGVARGDRSAWEVNARADPTAFPVGGSEAERSLGCLRAKSGSALQHVRSVALERATPRFHRSIRRSIGRSPRKTGPDRASGLKAPIGRVPYAAPRDRRRGSNSKGAFSDHFLRRAEQTSGPGW